MANVINATSTGSGGLVSTGDDSGILNIQTNETTAITVDASQNVGIGGAATNEGGYARCLQVTGSTEAALEVKTGSSYSYFAQNGTNLQIRNNDASGNMTFSTNATERMRIDSSGNLLVGTTSVSSGKLNVVYTGTYGVYVGGASGASTQMIFFSGATNTGSISSNGSNTAFNTSSDYRLKENIAPMTGCLSKVQALKPVTYRWKESGLESQGFIAHELAEVCPEAVTGAKDAVDANGNPIYQGIDTSFLVATLTAAIQELKAINDQQAETINALTARVAVLEGQ